MKAVRSQKAPGGAVERGVQRFHEYAKGRGLRASASRDAVVRAALGLKRHFDAEALARTVPEHNIATVYRALPLLIEAGLIRAVPTAGDTQIFERIFERDDHDHLVCTACGHVVEFRSEAIERLQRNLAQRHAFSVTNRMNQIFGVCSKCQVLVGRRA